MKAFKTSLLTTWFLLAVPALALAHDGGEGWYGETDDKVITQAGFILIAAFPALIMVISLIQGRLEKRKEARLKAAAARKARQDQRGGWEPRGPRAPGADLPGRGERPAAARARRLRPAGGARPPR